jgi:hypothetical protein
VEHPLASLSPDERALLALEDAVIDAIRRRDPKALGALLTEDFVLLGSDGSETRRADFLRAAVEIPGEILELSVLHLRARVVGGVGVLTGLQRARVRLPTEVEVDDVAFFTDVCMRTGTGWRMALAHSGPRCCPAPPARPPARLSQRGALVPRVRGGGAQAGVRVLHHRLDVGER